MGSAYNGLKFLVEKQKEKLYIVFAGKLCFGFYSIYSLIIENNNKMCYNDKNIEKILYIFIFFCTIIYEGLKRQTRRKI